MSWAHHPEASQKPEDLNAVSSTAGLSGDIIDEIPMGILAPKFPLLVMFFTGGSFCIGLDKALSATDGFPVSQEVVFLGLDK